MILFYKLFQLIYITPFLIINWMSNKTSICNLNPISLAQIICINDVTSKFFDFVT